eukprot:scaffold350_cov133-Cylindrotheca_fusiformis.AAC.6
MNFSGPRWSVCGHRRITKTILNLTGSWFLVSFSFWFLVVFFDFLERGEKRGEKKREAILTAGGDDPWFTGTTKCGVTSFTLSSGQSRTLGQFQTYKLEAEVCINKRVLASYHESALVHYSAVDSICFCFQQCSIFRAGKR